MSRLGTDFFDRPTLVVAEELIGCRLVRELDGRLMVGRIVETEAYDGPHDRASHASRRLTPRNAVMFGPPGFTYVYLIYGMYNCLNVVTGPADYPAAVLIRALEPLENVELSTSGPGRLCRALAIDRSLSGLDVAGRSCPIRFYPRDAGTVHIGTSPRIGVHYAGEWADAPYRFFEVRNPHVSKVPVKRAQS